MNSDNSLDANLFGEQSNVNNQIQNTFPFGDGPLTVCIAIGEEDSDSNQSGNEYKDDDLVESNFEIEVQQENKKDDVKEACRRRKTKFDDLRRCERFRTDNPEMPYQCGLCEKYFANSTAFIAHNHTREYLGKTIHKCDVCNKTFPFPNALRAHMRVHTGERPYVCDMCDFRFTALSALNKHKILHFNKTPYKCEFCEKPFKSSEALKIHRRSHTGERPYLCRQCNEGFTSASHVKRHILKDHLKEKRFVCHICSKGFYVIAGLRQHLNTHTGYKPFLCQFCSATFRTNSHLERHIKAKHSNNTPLMYMVPC